MVEFATTLHLEEREKVVQQRIDQYFEQQGYRAKYDSHNDIFYERGSALGNYIAMNPASWHVFAFVSVHSTGEHAVGVDVRLKVDAQGQIVLGRERKYWETEFDVLTTYLETGKTKNDDILGELDRHNQRQNIILTVAIGFMILIAGLLLLPTMLNSMF